MRARHGTAHGRAAHTNVRARVPPPVVRPSLSHRPYAIAPSSPRSITLRRLPVMSGHEQARVSVLVPARNEEGILPTTLPAILKAVRELPCPAEVLVIVPPQSPALNAPPVRDPFLTWLPTSQPGKFNALRVGADAAHGEFLL